MKTVIEMAIEAGNARDDWNDWRDDQGVYPTALNPPARCPWVGLTHEDIVIILNNDYGGSRADCIRAAEAKLKEYNT